MRRFLPALILTTLTGLAGCGGSDSPSTPAPADPVLGWTHERGPICANAIWASSGTAENLIAVSGSSGKDIFAVEQGGKVIHFDGMTRAPAASSRSLSLISLWATSADDVIAVGRDGAIIRWQELP